MMFTISCIQCASVQGQGYRGKPPFKSIEVGGPFECVGMDFLEMDRSKEGNRYALVFQDYLAKGIPCEGLQSRDCG